MSQKVVSPASAPGGEGVRNGRVGSRVGPKRDDLVTDVAHRHVIERLREQIRCIERRTPVLDSKSPAPVPALGRQAAAATEAVDRRDLRERGANGTRLPGEPVPDQAGLPAIRLAPEDGGVKPRISPPSSPSSFSRFESIVAPPDGPRPSRTARPPWTLGDGRAMDAVGSRQSLADLALDDAGVHEIKPSHGGAHRPVRSDDRSGGRSDGQPDAKPDDWAASWGAARRFALALVARRVQLAQRPVLWCMPRSARAEHGRLHAHGLRSFALTPADVLIVETGNANDTLWTLEEGLKSAALGLVVGMIDDVALTPARRLALAAQKHATPCLLLTHPRGPVAGATATRWRVAAWPGAPHPLDGAQGPGSQGPGSQGPGVQRPGVQGASGQGVGAPGVGSGLGARRLALTLERYRAAPARVTGRARIMEWCDEAVCLRMVANVPDRSSASRAPAIGATGSAVRAG